MIEFNFILNFLDLVFLQGDLFGIREGPLGSADPLVKGMLPSAFAVIGFSIMLNLFNAGVRKKLVDSVKLKRIMKETKSWQKERMRAFKSKDEAKIAELSKKSKKFRIKLNSIIGLSHLIRNLPPLQSFPHD